MTSAREGYSEQQVGGALVTREPQQALGLLSFYVLKSLMPVLVLMYEIEFAGQANSNKVK